MLTKKHFIAIAEILADTRAPKRTIVAFCDYLQQENGAFQPWAFCTRIANRKIERSLPTTNILPFKPK